MPYKTKESQAKGSRKYYLKNKAQRLVDNKTRKLDAQKWVRDYKSALKCERCPENHPACLDFHHKDRTTKTVEISNMVRRGWSTARMQAEIDKCSVLCANCHRKETFPLGVAQPG